jgi:hypothetical protein
MKVIDMILGKVGISSVVINLIENSREKPREKPIEKPKEEAKPSLFKEMAENPESFKLEAYVESGELIVKIKKKES